MSDWRPVIALEQDEQGITRGVQIDGVSIDGKALHSVSIEMHPDLNDRGVAARVTIVIDAGGLYTQGVVP